MMELKLVRDQPKPGCTLGKLFVDNRFACFTCEDVERPGAAKVHGQTAIPRGRYRIVITPSQHCKRDLPLLVNVPNFEGVRIHSGNTAADTEGCILPGKHRTESAVTESRVAFTALFAQIEGALAGGEDVFIEVIGS